MPESKASNDILSTIKDIRDTGTKELSSSVGSMLSATPPKPVEKDSTIVENISQKAGNLATNLTGGEKTPTVSSDQISVAQEKWEKEVIERRNSA